MKKTFLLSAMTLAVVAALSSSPSYAMTNTDNKFWWPEQLDLRPLRQNGIESNPLDKNFNYAQEFKRLDIKAVKADIEKVMKTSQPWWPADYGTYAPFFIRMAWHSAGVYRVFDGRGGAAGGQQRFEALNSWPDNTSLDKARRLLWPVKQKYGNQISWGDLMVLTGNVALESMGFKTFGFAGGRVDDWEAEIVNWGPEKKFLDDKRYSGKRDLVQPLAAVQMGLIYVNPEGPNGNPDPLLAAQDIRETFGRMAMNDEETVALIAGGHTFGKAHGAHKPEECLGKEPATAGIEEQGLGWKNKCGKGYSEDTVTSGLEGAWSVNPTQWTTQYLDNLFNFEWVQTKSPAGGIQWEPANADNTKFVPDAHIPNKRHAPIMFTTDLSLKFDPSYSKIAKRFKDHPEEYQLAFAKAWFKLTHRDMGPRTRYLGAEVPKEVLIWQDPIPALNHALIDTQDIAILKSVILSSGVSSSALIRTAWASASTFRGTDMRGGANGARIRLAPQKDWEANNPIELQSVITKLESVQKAFNKTLKGDKQVSLADVIVLAGNVAVEQAAKKAGFEIKVPFKLGRMDANQSQTDVQSFSFLKPTADAFRNYYTSDSYLSPTEALVDKAVMLNLNIPEMTALLGGLRVLDTNTGNTQHGVFTSRPGTLSNDFFVNLLDMSTEWKKSSKEGLFEGYDRSNKKLKWSATPVDLIFGSHSELRAVSEVYAASGGNKKLVQDFVKAWSKVMEADRF
ncbi:MAG: catalase/peroxidase HPI [Methylotenera sp.]|jgi:catalase-peroxidase|uniref:catalase/peroxidase HPI n=1 Tax=Methylotenera TaxID=359407 RepID=UPI00037916DE|nr:MULTISPECIES: catalase/peroxidase HPI [Methylotenera]MDP3777572.1 catalase/peroxidase HPI [Methylotenera sp.]PPC96347.1 MAG: catalase/peroxidase HPI [Methylotenera sp.]PPD00010.1 MAG: catalase/peroxidase HPI [Methylotenera sp.]